jgi:hypothetical protein
MTQSSQAAPRLGSTGKEGQPRMARHGLVLAEELGLKPSVLQVPVCILAPDLLFSSILRFYFTFIPIIPITFVIFIIFIDIFVAIFYNYFAEFFLS